MAYVWRHPGILQPCELTTSYVRIPSASLLSSLCYCSGRFESSSYPAISVVVRSVGWSSFESIPKQDARQVLARSVAKMPAAAVKGTLHRPVYCGPLILGRSRRYTQMGRLFDQNAVAKYRLRLNIDIRPFTLLKLTPQFRHHHLDLHYHCTWSRRS